MKSLAAHGLGREAFRLDSGKDNARSFLSRSLPVSIPSDADVDSLIARLAGPLTPDARPAFRRAAETALSQISCQGEGAVYRAIAPLQRAFFDPPNDYRASWDISQESRASKLRAAPAIAYGGDQRRVRYRRQLKAVD
jgi:hypothetical protein